jgi:3-deoxy-manno-octulosonate cytidylyltransferase (CMP-KDO synthetase)
MTSTTSTSSPSLDSLLTVIPARYASQRFPGKPLALIQGKPMILHTCDRVEEAHLPGQLRVATDHPEIAEVVQASGRSVFLTQADHPSGTDRVWEVAQSVPSAQWILNVQGDEPFLSPEALQTLVQAPLKAPDFDIYTLACPIGWDAQTGEDWLQRVENPNQVKLVKDQVGRVLYCSRSPIPASRGGWQEARDTDAWKTLPIYRHLGLYLYQRPALEAFCGWPPSALEALECLEQLRALENGLTLHASVVPQAPHGVDTPDDLERLVF